LTAFGFWAIYLGTSAVIDAFSVLTEHARYGQPLEPWEPFVWEFSSALLVGLLVIAIARLNQLFRISKDSWRLPLALHLLATVPFSLVHVGGMVSLRKLAYLVVDRSYDFGPLSTELLYEFRKDFVTYAFILGVIYLWQHLRFLSAVRPDPARSTDERLRRLIARKHDREFVIAVDGVNWIEASGNYANLHHKDGIFPVRSSMAELERRLDAEHFARVHRSYIVNLDRINEIVPTVNGDYRIHMSDGAEIRCSRRYRTHLKDRLDT